jgi:hypothetical protein
MFTILASYDTLLGLIPLHYCGQAVIESRQTSRQRASQMAVMRPDFVVRIPQRTCCHNPFSLPKYFGIVL